jgi:hypothetical protein
MKPAADTHLRTRGAAPSDRHPREPGHQAENLPDAATALGYAATFPGRADQVGQVRREIATYLQLSRRRRHHPHRQLVANAILHTQSRGSTFHVGCQLSPGTARIEIEDLGGPWRQRNSDDRPHGLDIVQALTGPDGWGTRITGTGGRIVWAQLAW